jgi:predicted PurR-regulated permease PerM
VAFAGLGDPLLWGTVAFLLNFVPILGPMIGVVIFLLAGCYRSKRFGSPSCPPRFT